MSPAGRHMCARDVARFVAACVATAWVLRRHSLQRAVEAVVARKRASVRAPDLDTDLAADLVPIFPALAVIYVQWASALPVSCPVPHPVFGELTASTLNFVMGRKRLSPGPRTVWVHTAPTFVDGTPEQVRFYTPILVV